MPRSIGGFYMNNPDVFLTCVDELDNSRFKEFDILDGLITVKLTDQSFPLLQPRPKATEIMYLEGDDLYDRMIEILPKKPVKGGGNDEFIILGDIIVANTIPSPDIEFVEDIDNNFRTVSQVIIFPHDTIIELIKTSRQHKKKEDDTDINEIYQIGTIEMRMIDGTGVENTRCRLRVALQMNVTNLELMFSPFLVSSSSFFYEHIEDMGIDKLESVYRVAAKIFVFGYATQTALLNPVIAERFHRETVPYDMGKKTNKKGKKAPKRYVKRITLGDISDLEFGREKRPHQIKEPLWWVSGHWRNQATKDGHKKIFIQGYWKGILRNESDSINAEPREREIVFEENDGKPYFID